LIARDCGLTSREYKFWECGEKKREVKKELGRDLGGGQTLLRVEVGRGLVNEVDISSLAERQDDGNTLKLATGQVLDLFAKMRTTQETQERNKGRNVSDNGKTCAYWERTAVRIALTPSEERVFQTT